jgi:hypothetical protein
MWWRLPAAVASGRLSGDQEIDHDLARLARDVGDLNMVAIVIIDLRQQRQGIVVVTKTHGFAALQRGQGAENGGMPEALGDAARIEGIDACGLNWMGTIVCHVKTPKIKK